MSEAQPSPGEEVVAGTIERIAFHNEENGFCVLRVRARGHRDVVTVVGHVGSISAGEWLTANGEWVNDRVHGQQFKARTVSASRPTSLDGIEKYLASGGISGVGPVYAKRLIKAFGEDVLDVIENEPQRLRTVDGIGRVRAGRIVAGWAEQKAVREIMVFLHGHGLSTGEAARIFKAYGAEAVTVMTENPYRLASDIRGFGFTTADRIASKFGIEKTAMVRVCAGISYALTEAMSDGHCGLPRAELVALACRLLEVPEELVDQALDRELAGGRVVADTVEGTQAVFLAHLHTAERTIAARVRALASGKTPWPAIEPEKAIAWVEERTGLGLADSQRDAVRLALSSKFMVVTGGPGVGKTTIVNAILAILGAKHLEILLAAPTGRAAKRLSETTGRDASTIHRLLEVDPRHGTFRRNRADPLDCDMLVVDETSMVDVPLMQVLVQAVPDHAAVLLVGDIDQLPSIGPGQVLADIIASGAVTVVRLTQIFRQAAGSRIIETAHGINAGRMPDLAAPTESGEGAESDFYFVPAEDPETAVRRIVELVARRIPRRFGLDPVRDIQVLAPMNRGGVGVRSLNLELKAALNPAGEIRVECMGWTYSPGDKVMQTENDYDRDIYNGDIGFITEVEPQTGEVAVDFDGRILGFTSPELSSLVPAYAATIHKAQGSEYPAVVMPLMMQHAPLLQRNLVYTGLTRAKRLVVLVGQKKAIAMAVRNVSGRRRWSKLAELLAGSNEKRG